MRPDDELRAKMANSALRETFKKDVMAFRKMLEGVDREIESKQRVKCSSFERALRDSKFTLRNVPKGVKIAF
ncbi:hypothetical protein [Halarcobacter anaerophilus]|uniref:hypothetical protein n=1 Tax=Halarcobacter anaerophilus TaxID=877500 RepID=UPI0012FECACB|nr:hypothetical protein [Halarcobacter anaerophilus]